MPRALRAARRGSHAKTADFLRNPARLAQKRGHHDWRLTESNPRASSRTRRERNGCESIRGDRLLHRRWAPKADRREPTARAREGARDNASALRWHYRDPSLAWLLPLAYAAHLLEEWFAGFPEWIGLIAGAPLPRAAFIVINAIAMALAIAATRASTRRDEYGWAGIAVASVLFVNAFAHAFGTVITRTYSPGLITGLVLYAPIAGLVLLRASTQALPGAFGRGVAVGVAAHAIVFVIAFAMAG
jgi:hypothetical protein